MDTSNQKMHFIFKPQVKIFAGLLMLIGVAAAVLGYLDHDTHGERFWSNLLINGFFFFGIALGALFFLALQYVSQAGWSVVLKRVFEATALFLPIGALFILAAIAASSLHLSHTYHWMAEGIMQVGHENYDAIIAGKAGFLNQPFFWLRSLLYVGTLSFFLYSFRKRSLREDREGGLALYPKNINFAATFMVLFAVISSVMAWDWIMSIDTHWFSTLFGWYTFAGSWCSAMIFMTLLALWLKSLGYLKEVNENHLHDMTKWIFALSFLWSYTWFSQFMLIWYANIPEEVTYYQERFETFTLSTWITFAINFVVPMLLLMSRPAKRNWFWISSVGLIVLVGHWFDVYLMVMPGTLHHKAQVGFVEIGMFLGFVGLFIWVVLHYLSKAPLITAQNPLLQESVEHHF